MLPEDGFCEFRRGLLVRASCGCVCVSMCLCISLSVRVCVVWLSWLLLL